MGLGKVAKSAKSKALNKEKKNGRRKKPVPIEEAKDKVVALGEAIVDLDKEIDTLETQGRALQEKLNKTKLGQELAAIRADLAEKKKQIGTLEKEAIPLVKAVDPTHKRVELPSGHALEVAVQKGSKSSANTLTNLKAILGEEEADSYWSELDKHVKETEYLSLETPEEE